MAAGGNMAWRAFIACAASVPALLAFRLVQGVVEHNAAIGAFYDPVNLPLAQWFLDACILAAALLAAWSWRLHRAGQAHPQLTTLVSVVLTVSYTGLAILYGPLTTPMGFVLMGVLAFGLVFFDRRAVLAGLVLTLAILAGNELALALGWVKYAPLLSHSMFVDNSTTLAWWWEISLRAIFYIALAAFFTLLLFQVGQLEAQRRALEALSTTDPLTGVANRRHFGERLADEGLRHRRSGRAFSLLLCDADHFKKVNDTWGHHAGDEVLKFLAATLAAEVRADIDLVGRLGGEEFAVILPETPLDGAVEVAGRIVERLRAHTFDIGGARFRVTLSVGAAACADGDGEAALRAADAALYEAKSGGRDRVVAAGAQGSVEPGAQSASP